MGASPIPGMITNANGSSVAMSNTHIPSNMNQARHLRGLQRAAARHPHRLWRVHHTRDSNGREPVSQVLDYTPRKLSRCLNLSRKYFVPNPFEISPLALTNRPWYSVRVHSPNVQRRGTPIYLLILTPPEQACSHPLGRRFPTPLVVRALEGPSAPESLPPAPTGTTARPPIAPLDPVPCLCTRVSLHVGEPVNWVRGCITACCPLFH